MIHIKEAIIVEGRYDRIKLSSIVDGLILETGGFRIFKDKEKMAMLRRLAETRGLLILTDSDGAGFVIRRYLSGSIPKEQIRHAYIPDRYGKEKRKEKPGKEGKLGVEGIDADELLEVLQRAGVCCEESGEKAPGQPVTKADLFALGLTGGQNSVEKRAAVLKKLDLPGHLTAKTMLPVVNTLFTRAEFFEICQQVAGVKKEEVSS